MPDDSALMLAARQRCGCGAVRPAAAAEDAAGEAVLRRGRLPPVRPHHRVAGILSDAHRAARCWRTSRRSWPPLVRGPAVLVEYGASDEAKAEFLLREGDGAPVFSAYVPIDVAAPQLEQMRARLRQRRPDLLVCIVPADFMDVVALPTQVPAVAAAWFLSRIDDRQSRSAGGATLPAARAWRAGRASRGSWWVSICARTRRSCCRRMTMRRASPRRSIATCWCGSIARPAPISTWTRSRIARSGTTKQAGSRCTWSVCASRSCGWPAQAIRFARGETIHTENSYKYAPERFAALAEEAGWHSAELWTDPAQVVLIASAGAAAGVARCACGEARNGRR